MEREGDLDARSDIQPTEGNVARPSAAGGARERAARRALGGTAPRLPDGAFAGRAATLLRGRALLGAPGLGRVDAGLVAAWAPFLVDLLDASAIVDLAPWASRHVRAFARALAARGCEGRCALQDARAPRLVAAVRALAAGFPDVRVRGVLTPHAFRPAPSPGVRPGPSAPPHLYLDDPRALDGMSVGALARRLRALAPVLRPRDAVLVALDASAEPGVLLAARSAVPVADAHRVALGDALAALGGAVDPRRLRFEARWRPELGVVETRLIPEAPLLLPAVLGRELRLEHPVRTGRAAPWTAARAAAVATRFGLDLVAWLVDPEERRALAVIRRAPCGPRGATIGF